MSLKISMFSGFWISRSIYKFDVPKNILTSMNIFDFKELKKDFWNPLIFHFSISVSAFIIYDVI